jgi:hypothetical protein
MSPPGSAGKAASLRHLYSAGQRRTSARSRWSATARGEGGVGGGEPTRPRGAVLGIGEVSGAEGPTQGRKAADARGGGDGGGGAGGGRRRNWIGHGCGWEASGCGRKKVAAACRTGWATSNF